MSLTSVVLNARYPDWLWRTQTKTPMGSEQTRTQLHFFKMKHQHRTAVTVLAMHAVTSLLFISPIYASQYKHTYAKKKHSFASYHAAKHPKRSIFAITNIREKPANFFYCSTPASTLVSAIILQTQVPLQKFPFLFIIIIPWLKLSGKCFCMNVS